MTIPDFRVVQAPFFRSAHFTTHVEGARFIEIRNYPVPLEVFYGGSWVDVRLLIRDRDTGAEEPIQFRFNPPRSFESPAHMVRDAIAWVLTHELEECLHVDGVRVFDPHRGSGP